MNHAGTNRHLVSPLSAPSRPALRARPARLPHRAPGDPKMGVEPFFPSLHPTPLRVDWLLARS
jgi:hypothetical protein